MPGTLHMSRGPEAGSMEKLPRIQTSPSGEGNFAHSRSKTELRIGLPSLGDTSPREGHRKRLPNTRSHSFQPTPRTLADDEQPKIFNEVPVPFQPQSFSGPLMRVLVTGKNIHNAVDDVTSSSEPPPTSQTRPDVSRSSQVLRSMEQKRRHGDMWASPETVGTSKHFMFKSSNKKLEHIFGEYSRLSKQEQIMLEAEYIERIRYLRHRREMLPHRESQDFMMGGHRVELSERENADVYQELKRLKTMVLPAVARDLYIGRGFTLPRKHALNNPRKPWTPAKKGGGNVTGRSGNNLTMIPGRGNVTGVKGNKLAVQKPTKADDATTNGEATDDPLRNDANDPEEKSDQELPEALRNDAEETGNQPESPEEARLPDNGHSPAPENTQPPHLLKGGVTDMTTKYEEAKAQYQKLVNGSEKMDFEQIKSTLPGKLSPAEENFIQKIYAVCSTESALEEEEYLMLHHLSDTIDSLHESQKTAFEKMDPAQLEDNIVKFGDLYESVDRQQTGRITMTSLQEVIQSLSQTELTEEHVTRLDPNGEGSITRLAFLANIPYLVSISSP